MANSIGISALVLSGISFVLAIVETAIPYWTYTSAGEACVSSGLWKACASTGLSNSACISFDIVTDWLKAVRAMEILGLLIIGAAGLCGFLKLFVMKEQNMLPKLSAALSMAAGAFMLIGAIIYAAKFTDANPAGSPTHLFAAFGLAIVAAVLAFVAGIVFIIADNKQQI